MSDDQAKYISLKEAAAISGYAPDYVGQLIRAGKIPGKQVYFSAAWMTTEESLKNYIGKNERSSAFDGKFTEIVQRFKNGTFPENKLAGVFRVILWFIISLSVMFLFVLFYVFSVNFEKSVNQKVIEKSKSNYGLFR